MPSTDYGEGKLNDSVMTTEILAEYEVILTQKVAPEIALHAITAIPEEIRRMLEYSYTMQTTPSPASPSTGQSKKAF